VEGGVVVLRNEDVRRVLVGVPRGHRHVRALIELSDGSKLVLQEATLANIVRAYIAVATHPLRRGVELVGVRLKDRKAGFAEYQLLESGRDEEFVVSELAEAVGRELPERGRGE